METHKRSIVKALSWRVLATTITGLAAWGVTGSFQTGLGICLIDCLIKTAIYYFHERMWQGFKWGLVTGEIVDGSGGGI